MIEFLLTAGLWLGLFVFVFSACVVLTCAAEEIRDVPRGFGPLNTHDWDAPDRGLRNE